MTPYEVRVSFLVTAKNEENAFNKVIKALNLAGQLANEADARIIKTSIVEQPEAQVT